MTQTRLTTLAALLMAALLLAGCGGGGGGGEPTVTQTVHDELQAELDAALANLTKEHEAKATAEEARAAADTARMAADEARATAEAERDTAQQARTDAEAARTAAEAAQADAEMARQAAADAQAAAEGERDTAEASEAAAKAAEALALAAEMAAKAAQATAEAERDDAKAAELAAKAAEAEALAAQAEAVAAELAAKATQTAAEAARDKALADKTAVEADRDTKRDAARDAEIELIEVKAARDAALAQVTRLTGELETANADVTRLTNQIGTADDADSLQGMLAAEKAKVATLTAQIGSAQDQASDAEGASLHAQLNAANAEVTRLEGELGTATDMADAAGSLHAQLAAEKDEVTRLKTLIGAEADTADDDGSLYARLNHAKDEAARIQGLLDTANGRVDELETLVGDAVNPSSTSLRGQLAAAKSEAATLRGELAGALGDVTEAEQRADQAEREADQRVTEIERQGDTNTQGRGLQTALELVLVNTTWALPDDTAMVDINDRGTDIEITASPLTGSTRKSGNFYTATLTYTAPGVSQPEHKTVVYTDREKSRSFADHYASSIGDGVGGSSANPRFVNAIWGGRGDLLSAAVKKYVSNVSGDTSTIAVGATPPSQKLVDRLSARVHGVSGHYGCHNANTGAACKITVTTNYENDPAAGETRRKLTSLEIAPDTDGTLYFDPGSGMISLLELAEKSGVPTVTDEQYITFGWWQERPGLADGTYQAAVFADITPTAYSGARGSAVYQGPAVGLYVDRTSDGSTTTYESGDFTATAILRATFGSNTNPVSGDVTNFRTPHGAKNWHVKLTGDGDDDDTVPDARIIQTGTISTGTWEHKLLARNLADNSTPETGGVDTDDAQPIAVTGRFAVSIPNVRHIVGAFGAHRITDPLEAE